MLCEYCLQNKASVLLTKIINGKKNTINLCESCAGKQTNDLQKQFSTTEKLPLNSPDFSKQLKDIT